MRDCVNIFLKNNMPNHLLQMVKEMDDQKTKINNNKNIKEMEKLELREKIQNIQNRILEKGKRRMLSLSSLQ
jgi:hypothetical protein